MKNWTIKIKLSVDDSWVADGFNAAERIEQIKELLSDLLPYAYEHEFTIDAKITNAPSQETINKLQGY